MTAKAVITAMTATAMTALLVPVLAGCGHEVAGASGGAGASGSATAAGAIPWIEGAPIEVTGIRTASGGRALDITVTVPSGADGTKGCTRALKSRVETVENDVVYAMVTIETRSGDLGSGCTASRTATTRLPLDDALGSRSVMINNFPSDVFTPDGATPPALRKCDDRLGCDPAPVGCTPASYDQALAVTDVGAHTRLQERGCDGHWLVLDLSTRVGPVCGEPDAGCDATVERRYFYRAGTSRWQPLTSTADAGCAAARRAAPDFPARLCADLPALPAHGGD
ncbi:hypothetical protein ACFV6E_28670 [Streptomyces sp. NPDC059785]|uniref:hypothetical protein n=1 Tax=Streptomyces sp. NPDC059785 TaxID=3346945 RepID=UPI003652B48B